MKRTKSRTCGTKIPHASKQDALTHSIRLRKQGATLSQATVYRCPYCKKFHVGHRPRGGKR